MTIFTANISLSKTSPIYTENYTKHSVNY